MFGTKWTQRPVWSTLLVSHHVPQKSSPDGPVQSRPDTPGLRPGSAPVQFRAGYRSTCFRATASGRLLKAYCCRESDPEGKLRLKWNLETEPRDSGSLGGKNLRFQKCQRELERSLNRTVEKIMWGSTSLWNWKTLKPAQNVAGIGSSLWMMDWKHWRQTLTLKLEPTVCKIKTGLTQNLFLFCNVGELTLYCHDCTVGTF